MGDRVYNTICVEGVGRERERERVVQWCDGLVGRGGGVRDVDKSRGCDVTNTAIKIADVVNVVNIAEWLIWLMC